MTSQWSLIFVIVLAAANPLIIGSRGYIKAEPRGYGGPAASLTEESASLSGSLIYPLGSNDGSLLPEPVIVSTEALAVGVAIPLGTYAKPLLPAGQAGRETAQLYFTLPTRGWNWGILHDFNAVDIADACGKPIYASAEGLVIEEFGSNRWNDGYGNYVLIEHPNGTKTRYAHTLRNIVAVADYVAQGDQIALIGRTGNTTGCHLHFEVYGAKNPFAIR